MHAGSARPSVLESLTHSLNGSPLLAWIAAGWLVGDASAAHAVGLPAALLALLAGFASLLLLCLAARPVWRRVALALLAFTYGHLAAMRVYRPSFPAEHAALAPMHVPVRIEGVAVDDAGGGGRPARLLLVAQRIDAGDGWHMASGQMWLTIRSAQHAWRAGDDVRMAASLRRPRNFGNPGEFDSEGYLARRGIYVTGYVEDDSGFELIGSAGDGGDGGWMARWRRGVGELIDRTLSEPESAVLKALIIGTEAELPRDLRTAFSRAGVSHVLSISGLHVGLVAAAGYALFRWLLARSRWLLLSVNVPKLAVALSLVPVLLYAGIAGSNVATARSVIMIVIFLGAVMVDRQRHLIVGLAVAAIAILLSSPGAALDISFQLSFVAVLGLALAMERFWPWWRRWEEMRLLRLRSGWIVRLRRPIAAYVVVSLSALAATLPLTAWHFNQVSLIAVLANAVVVPLLGSVAVTLGLLAALLYALSTWLATGCILVAGPFVKLGIWLVEVFAAFPYAAVRVVTPTLVELTLLYAVLLTVVLLSGRVRIVSLAILALLVFGDGGWWYMDRYHRADMRVTFLSVGQGDSAVIEFPGAAVMVVDGGGLGSESFDVGERIIAPFLWSRKIARVDYLVMSHPQWDHYGGLTFLAANFAAREFWSNGTTATSERFAHLQRALREQDVHCIAMRRGDRRQIGVAEAAIESPPSEADEFGVNDQSLVLSVRFAGTRLLFPGDIETPAEGALVAASDGQLKSAVLKVPHHGSHTSSSPRFLDAVAPRLAVVSAGFENRFGFPHRDVLERYSARHCGLVRTDVDGAVEVRVAADGRIEVQSYYERRETK